MSTHTADRDRPASFLPWWLYLAVFGVGVLVLTANVVSALVFSVFDWDYLIYPVFFLSLTWMTYWVDVRATDQVRALEAERAQIWDSAYFLGVSDHETSMDFDGGKTPAARVNPWRER